MRAGGAIPLFFMNEIELVNYQYLRLLNYYKILNRNSFMSNGELRRIQTKVRAIQTYGARSVMDFKQEILQDISERMKANEPKIKSA